MGFRKLEELDAPGAARPQPTMSPRDVLRVFEEFVRRDRYVGRKAAERADLSAVASTRSAPAAE